MQNYTEENILMTQLFDLQPQPTFWMKPFYADEGSPSEIADFEICYCNKAAIVMMAGIKQTGLQKFLIRDKLLGDESEIIFDQSRQVFETNTSCEFNYYNHYYKKHFNVVRTR